MKDQVKCRFNLSATITIVAMSLLYIGDADSQSILGESADGIGVRGVSTSDYGVSGVSTSGIGVHGRSISYNGVRGFSISNYGVYGGSISEAGVYGFSESGIGVSGFSTSNYGVHGVSSKYHGAFFRGDKDGGYADIILKGSSNTSAGDNGIIMSDPGLPGSDLFMVANDAVVAKLDNNKNGTGNFLVYNGNNTTIFQVDINGNVSAQGSTFNGSDRNRKELITDLSYPEVLQAMIKMPIYEWQYKGETRRHIGPMAQDFHTAFGLGDDDKTIATIDADGVALAAIKAQQEIIEELKSEISSLHQTVSQLATEVKTLRGKRQKRSR